MSSVGDAEDAAFREADEAAGSGRFLGLVDRRYVRTFAGTIHALASVFALLVGNCLFVQRIALNRRGGEYEDDRLGMLFHVCSALSGGTLLLFWNKVQSWQLSTTTMKEKGLRAQQLQNFNRGRGVVGMVLCAAYPLLYRGLTVAQLQDPILSRVVASLVLTLSLFQYTLIRDYGKALFIVYGASKFGFSLQVLWLGSLEAVWDRFPFAVEFLDKEALFLVSCVEFGFLWYYLYSRRLVGKDFIQTACKNYHPVMLYVYMARMTAESWWRHLPLSLSWVMAVDTLLTVLFLFKIIKSFFSSLITWSKPTISSNTQVTEGKRRRSSIFEVTSANSLRRSSVFEHIDVGLLGEKED